MVLTDAVQENNSVDQSHHGAPVSEDGRQAHEGPFRAPQYSKQQRDDENDNVVDQQHGGLGK